ELTARTTAARPDAFTPAHALGLHAGNTYARITKPMTTTDLARTTAQPPDTARTTSHPLAPHGPVIGTPAGRPPAGIDAGDAAAPRRAVTGTLQGRAERYRVERVLWGWWRSEETWMKTSGRHRRSKRPSLAQPAPAFGHPWDLFPAYPRSGRRGDHRAARAAVLAGELPHAHRPAA